MMTETGPGGLTAGSQVIQHTRETSAHIAVGIDRNRNYGFIVDLRHHW